MILGIDPSTTATGICLLDGEDYRTHIIKPPSKEVIFN